ncbi:ABC transporter permease [Priestia endophytica]|uniref:ABC transporter permease n=1 Tax=Priestia endophytica TaxID=135735 RepID=UPI0020419AD2|nr:ABC transporter permease [Priestia endophytica]MCM3537573.1 ABC transporter permease [Priestia endophytica]
MSLFSIARKNMRKNFKNYFLYFTSLIFSIVIYFTFISLKYDKTIQATSDSSTKISSAFNGASVILIIFVAIFIWYSNTFFTRKRKKEVGLYALLGVRKKQIGRMLFYENFIMGIGALFVGIILGTVLSRFFVSLLMRIMGYEVLGNFEISFSAVINTVIVFLIITLIASFQGYRLVYRFQLIELFRADQEGEKEPKASFFIALLSLILIGIGYWLALQNLLKSEVWKTLGFMMTPFVILVTVILGSYLLFNTLSLYVLKLVKKNKSYAWRGSNLIGVSQLLYRIKGNARMLTIISILSATTLTAVGTAYSFYYNNKSNVEINDPNSMMFKNEDESKAKIVQDLIYQNKDHKVVYHKQISTLEPKGDITDLKNTLPFNTLMYTVISSTDFNELAKEQKRKDKISLKGDEAAVLEPAYFEGVTPKYVGSTVSLKGNEQVRDITFTKLKKYNVLNSYTAGATVVVSDDMFAQLAKNEKQINMEVYEITDEDHAKQLTERINAVLADNAQFSSFYEDYASGLEAAGLMIFMGGFLGLVFLAATGSIIYFKQLAEANADRSRYVVLYKIGVDKRQIKKTIAKQQAFIFTLPLIVGIAHCSIALTALSKLLQTNLVVPVLICISAYAFMYVLYYILTVNSYYKIVMKTNE